jgi:hypothetical protein
MQFPFHARRMQCFQHFDFRYIAEIDGKDRKVAIAMDEGL